LIFASKAWRANKPRSAFLAIGRIDNRLCLAYARARHSEGKRNPASTLRHFCDSYARFEQPSVVEASAMTDSAY
jgi:hypothetical protein